MELEFEGSVPGLHGKFKFVSTAPVISKPCEHVTTKKLFRKHVTRIHGAADGTSTVERIET